MGSKQHQRLGLCYELASYSGSLVRRSLARFLVGRMIVVVVVPALRGSIRTELGQATAAHGPFHLTTHIVNLNIFLTNDRIQTLDASILLGDLVVVILRKCHGFEK